MEETRGGAGLRAARLESEKCLSAGRGPVWRATGLGILGRGQHWRGRLGVTGMKMTEALDCMRSPDGRD